MMIILQGGHQMVKNLKHFILVLYARDTCLSFKNAHTK